MKIVDKVKLGRALITATTKEIILEFNNCYLNIYCLGDTYLTKIETIQVTTTNLFTGYLVIDKNNELINVIKDCCSKKSSELEFVVDLLNKAYLYYKKTNKLKAEILDINNLLTTKPEQLVKYLEIINRQKFSNEKLLEYKNYSIKTDTKYEYEVLEINEDIYYDRDEVVSKKPVLISNTDLELVPKVFDIEANKTITLKPELDVSNLKKKEIEAIKSNAENVIITYEDLVVSNSEELIQITNIEQNTYFYCKRCFKL